MTASRIGRTLVLVPGVLLLGGLSPLGSFGGLPFESPWQSFRTGAEPRMVVVTDVNGDALDDLVSVNRVGSSITILRGLGDRNFAAGGDFPAGPQPVALVAGDINGDARPDLVVVNSPTGPDAMPGYSVLLNDGQGAFPATTLHELALTPTALQLSDVTGDSIPDLVIAGTAPDRIQVHQGAGNGTFALLDEYPTSGRPLGITLRDVSGDSRNDLLVANSDSASISIRLKLPIGGFGPSTQLSAADTPIAIGVGSFNGDSPVDLAVVNTGTGVISVFLGTGGGGFGPKTNFAMIAGGRAIAIVDLNHDAHDDIIISSASGALSVSTGNGTGLFQSNVDHDAAAGCDGMSVTDIDEDGHLDVAVANPAPGTVSTFWGNGDASFGSGTRPVTRAFPSSLVVADVVGGADLDLVVTNQLSNNFSIYQGSGNGSFGFRNDVDLTQSAGPRSSAAADLNRDGQGDLLISRSALNSVAVYLRSGSQLSSPITISPTVSPQRIAVADVNQDTIPDLIVAGGTKINVRQGNGLGGFSNKGDIPMDGEPRNMTIADVSGDGIPDLVVCVRVLDKVAIFRGHGDFTFGERVDLFVSDTPRDVLSADLDGDLDLDLVVAEGNNIMRVFLNDAGNFGQGTPYATGRNPFAVTIGRVNADEFPDLAVANYSDHTITLYLGAGDGTFQYAAEFGTGREPVELTAADLDDDGDDDLVVVNQGANTLSILRNTSATTPIHLLSFHVMRTEAGRLVRWEVSEGDRHRLHRLHRSSLGADRIPLTERPFTGLTRYEFLDTESSQEDVAYWLEQIDRQGRHHWYGPIHLDADGAGEATIRLAPPSPTPFRHSTTISYALSTSSLVSLVVYDIQGRAVATLVDALQEAGTHFVEWQGNDHAGRRAPAGAYFVQLRSAALAETRKVLRIN